MKKILFTICALCAVLTTFNLEGGIHFGFGVSAPVVERRVARPVYVEEVYYEHPSCCYHTPVGYRRVYGYPMVEERVIMRPRPMFSFGFWR